MAITITEGYMDGEEKKQVSRSGEDQQARDTVPPFHKHCQKTVCSAYGYNGQGATWTTLTGNTNSDNMGLKNIQSILKSNKTVKGFFTQNTNNITQDLRSILELIDKVAESQPNFKLIFNNNHNIEIAKQQLQPATDQNTDYVFGGFGRDIELDIDGQKVKFNTMKKSDAYPENLSVELDRHSLTIKQDDAVVGTVSDIVMKEDKEISIPEVKMDFDRIYPVGSVYISTNDVDPNNLFEGTRWLRFGEGRCLWGASSSTDLLVEKESALPNIRGKSGAEMTNGQPSDPAEVFTGLDGDQAWSANSNSALYLKWSTNSGTTDPDGDHISTTQSVGGIGSSSGAGFYGIGFNASRCNPIYQDGVNTVQPPAIMVYFWRRIANGSTVVTFTQSSGRGTQAYSISGELNGTEISISIGNIEDIQAIDIGNTVTSIVGIHDFSGLTSVTIQNSVTSIAENAFSNCSGLTTITVLGKTIAQAQELLANAGVQSGCTIHCTDGDYVVS